MILPWFILNLEAVESRAWVDVEPAFAMLLDGGSGIDPAFVMLLDGGADVDPAFVMLADGGSGIEPARVKLLPSPKEDA